MDYGREDYNERDERYREEAETDNMKLQTAYERRRRMQEKDDWYSIHDEDNPWWAFFSDRRHTEHITYQSRGTASRLFGMWTGTGRTGG